MSCTLIVRVAHYHASADFPENTLLAFRQAMTDRPDLLHKVLHDATI